MSHVQGIHHVTAIASDPQRNVGFYAGVLGLRLVKRTVNFDDRRPITSTTATRSGRPAAS
jgi:glyoxalase family protein